MAAPEFSDSARPTTRLVADGLSNEEIGGRLFISECTVESHVRNIMNKLGFNSRAQIAGWIATSNRWRATHRPVRGEWHPDAVVMPKQPLMAAGRAFRDNDRAGAGNPVL